MSEERKTASAPGDFGPATEVIELPIPGPGGKKLCVEIQAANLDELVPYLKALPGAGRDAPAEKEYVEARGELDATLEFVKKHDEQARAIVKRWMVAPPVSFDGPRDGAIEWAALHLQNRIAIVNAISRLSSQGSAGVELATFPALDAGRRGDGGGAPGAVANGDPAAPLVPAASGPPAG